MFDPARQLGCPDDDDCHGGYRQVTAAYVERHAPMRPVPFPRVALNTPPEGLDGLALVEWNHQLAVNRHHVMIEKSQRTSTSNSVYPCHVCNPDQFLRWTDGDWPYPKRPARTERGSGGGDRPPPYTDADAPLDDEGLFDPAVVLPEVDPLTAHEHARADLQ